MNNPLLYPFLAICITLALPLVVWLYFAIKERRRRAEQTEHQRILTAPRPPVDVAPPYRHRGHPHAAARRGKNRADRRSGMPMNQYAKPSPRDFDFPEFYYGEKS